LERKGEEPLAGESGGGSGSTTGRMGEVVEVVPVGVAPGGRTRVVRAVVRLRQSRCMWNDSGVSHSYHVFIHSLVMFILRKIDPKKIYQPLYSLHP
jgi:hypothetical protein